MPDGFRKRVRLVLEDAGASWNDIVDVITVFLTNMKKDFRSITTLYAEYFAGDAQTQSYAHDRREVTALPTPIAIELKVIAAISE